MKESTEEKGRRKTCRGKQQLMDEVHRGGGESRKLNEQEERGYTSREERAEVKTGDARKEVWMRLDIINTRLQSIEINEKVSEAGGREETGGRRWENGKEKNESFT